MAEKPSITDRRHLLIGTSALALTGALTGVSTGAPAPEKVWRPPFAMAAETSGVDPAYVLYIRAKRAETQVNAFRGGSMDELEYKALFNTYITTERKLAATPARSLKGVLGKMKRIAADQEWQADDPYLVSCLGLSVMADLRRMIAALPTGWPGSTMDLGGQS